MGDSRMGYERGLVRLGPTTHAFLQPDGGWGWSNAGVVCGREETLLVDTFFDLSLTRSLLGAVASATPAPIRTLVNTHHNPDHTWGNQLVRGARIVGHRRCREELIKAPGPEFIAGLLKSPGDDGALGYLKRAFGGFDFSGITVTPPEETFEISLTLELEGRDVQLMYFGPAHTLGDIAVFVPDEGVLFCGDLLFLGSTPLVWEGSLQNWITAADGLLALGAGTIVPGHGPVCGPEGLREMQGYLKLVVSEGTRLREMGLPPLEAALEVDLGPYRDWVDSERIALNMRRLYLELDGQPPETQVDPFEAFAGMADVAARMS